MRLATPILLGGAGLAPLALIGRPLKAGSAPEQSSMPALYMLHCAGCHRMDGASLPAKGIPDLRVSGRYAGSVDGRQYLVQVPGVSQSRLDDRTATALLNWTLVRFSDHCLPANFKPFSVAEVRRWRGNPASDASRRQAKLNSESAVCHPADLRDHAL